MGPRTVLRYRNSPSMNIILAEAKVMTIRDRAGYLVKNFMMKTVASGNDQIKESLNTLLRVDEKVRFINLGARKGLIVKAWKKCNGMKYFVETRERYRIFESNYWSLTNKVLTDIKTGKLFQRGQNE